MFFAENDYKNIQNWLKLNSIKDSEMSLAQDIRDNDKLVIVQDGENKAVTAAVWAAMFSAFIDGYAREDFFNVTRYKYNKTENIEESKMNLEQAVSECPEEIRRGGQHITFLNKDGEWEIWRFLGDSIDKWEDVNTYWQCVDGREGLGINVNIDLETIQVGDTDAANIEISTKDGGKASYINVYKNGELVLVERNKASVQKSLTVDTDTLIKVEVIQYGISYTKEHQIKVVYPCFIGAQEAMLNIYAVLDQLTMIPGGELSGKFQVATNNINNRIYVVIPERVIINSITLILHQLLKVTLGLMLEIPVGFINTILLLVDSMLGMVTQTTAMRQVKMLQYGIFLMIELFLVLYLLVRRTLMNLLKQETYLLLNGMRIVVDTQLLLIQVAETMAMRIA